MQIYETNSAIGLFYTNRIALKNNLREERDPISIKSFTFAFEKNKIISHGHSRKDSNCTSGTGRNE
jgi:hypothetical protein